MGLLFNTVLIPVLGLAFTEKSSLNSPSEDPDNSKEGDDDAEGFTVNTEDEKHPAMASRWPTRVFAIDCMLKIMSVCQASPQQKTHFDMVKARQHKAQHKGENRFLSLNHICLILCDNGFIYIVLRFYCAVINPWKGCVRICVK